MPTPRASDANGAGHHGTGGLDLRTAVADAHKPVTQAGQDEHVSEFAWGDYEAAIRRWEAVTRDAPLPVDEKGRLSPAFVEWMMGLPEGHVSELSRTQALKACGNAVVPYQAHLALELLVRLAQLRTQGPHKIREDEK